ncbi:MAG: IS200/IS605 family transposase [Spirochaetaceae bacterium]|jgi:putative transposase|nr:IS200/IS605 family transposase [Spirochaetaceae bacterium]
MKDWQSLAHTKWDCKYHVVIVPKYRKKILYGKMKKRVGEILRELCKYKGIELLEGHAMPDHIHMCLSVPPKYSIAMTIGYLKGKSAIRIHRENPGTQKGFTNKNFWSRGYCVSTVGLDEKEIREYIQNQEMLETEEQGTLNFGDNENLN